METELNTKKNRLHDEAYWAQVTEELEREEEEEIEVLLEEMINQHEVQKQKAGIFLPANHKQLKS